MYFVLLNFVLLCAPALTHAQAPARLDDARFIQGLRERGMRELLLYYLETHPPSDPIAKLEVEIEQHKLIAQDPAAEPARRVQAMEDALATYQKLFDTAARSHPKQPLWKVDYAEYVLHTVLPVAHTNAGEFVEFGVPTRAQREAFNRLIPQVLTTIEDAAVDHFLLVGQLPKQDNFQEQFVNNGFWRTFMEEYGQIKLPFYRAWANYWATYLAKPAGNLGEANQALKGVSQQQILPGAAAELKNLHARVLMKMNQLDAANKLLDEVLAPPAPGSDATPTAPFDLFIARLAKSEALRIAKKNDPALAIIKQARGMELVQQSPMLLVLTYDRQFKITGDPEVYVQLFNDPAAAPAKQAIEGFVKSRMVEDKQMTVAEMAKAEPFIVLANVDALLTKGGQFQQQAGRAGTTQADQKKLLEQGGKAIADAREGLKQLLSRKGLSESIIAEAKLKLGAAEYQLGSRADAVAAWVDLASTLPQEKMAEAAAVNAFLVARKLWEENQKHPAAIKLFGDAQQVLLNKFPHARIGEDPVSLHWHTRAGFLRQTGEHQYAIDAFTKFVELNPDHALVSDALYQVLLAEHELYRAAPLKERPKYAEGVINAAKRALDALTKAAASAEGERAQTLKYQQGDAILRQAEVLSEGLGKHADAQTLLKGYDERFSAFPDLVRAKRELLVNILVGFGQVAEARSELEKFIQQFPDQGGAMMSQVLAAINRQIDELTRLGNADEAKQRASVGVDFAQFLLTWARQQPEYKDPAKQMPFQSMLAQQLMTAGRSDEALKIYNQLAATEAGQKNLQVLHGQAKTLFRLGRFDEALPVVNTILRLAPDQTAEEVWDAWMMRMAILDKQVDQYNAAGEKHDPAKAKKTSTQIFTTIEKLKQFNRELGGPPYKDELTRLQNKHFPR